MLCFLNLSRLVNLWRFNQSMVLTSCSAKQISTSLVYYLFISFSLYCSFQIGFQNVHWHFHGLHCNCYKCFFFFQIVRLRYFITCQLSGSFLQTVCEEWSLFHRFYIIFLQTILSFNHRQKSGHFASAFIGQRSFLLHLDRELPTISILIDVSCNQQGCQAL